MSHCYFPDVTYTGSVKLSKQEWSDDLKEPSSAAFKSLAGKLEKSVLTLLCHHLCFYRAVILVPRALRFFWSRGRPNRGGALW